MERARIEGPDHPRIRGEHLLSGVGGQDPAGSSPHTRGALSDAWRHWPVSGIIPAYAGSTSRLSRWRDSSPGSSPHTRGAQAMPSACAAQGGIIPAYAGSTGRCRPVRRHWRDHPRIRGEHHRPGEGPRPQEGSSPHTRGAPRPRPRRRRGDRIIPAYAGSTVDCVVVGFPEWDHPRIRGEHPTTTSPWPWRSGSSPHTRGARLIASWWAFRSGIIPAYAGSTLPYLLTDEYSQDHPRIRGEHPGVARAGRVADGSSPHTRGARRRLVGDRRGGRIIPAYAGSTNGSGSSYISIPDHPRIRGEH